MTKLEAGTCSCNSSTPRGGPGSIRAVVMGDGTNIEIPRDRGRRRAAAAGERAAGHRPATAIVSWMAQWRDVRVTTSGYQRWSRARLFPADGPLTVRAQGERELTTLGGKVDATRASGRHILKAGIDAVRLAPRETLSYVYDGYLEFTHLFELAHMHMSGPPLAFSGAESGGQVSLYVQDNLQAGHVTLDAGLRLDRYDLLVSATHFSPRVNAGIRLGDETMLHGSYNHFFVPPPIEGVLSSSAGLTRSIDEIGVALPPLEPVIEDQFEAGVATGLGPFELAVTTYYRDTENPVHTTLWPDSRIYSYASFDRGRAYGVEAKVEMSAARAGVTGFFNYAAGRVDFKNPVTGGFVTEAGHIIDTSWFRAPMDQTHTLTGGTTTLTPRRGFGRAARLNMAAARRWVMAWPRTNMWRAPRRTPTPRVARPRGAGAFYGRHRRRPPSLAGTHQAAEAGAASRSREHRESGLRDRAGGRIRPRADSTPRVLSVTSSSVTDALNRRDRAGVLSTPSRCYGSSSS